MSPQKFDRPLKFMILGYARHGKDTVGEILRDSFGLRVMSSSHFAAERVVRPYLASQGITYPTLEECYADRVNHRQVWFEQIKAYNEPDGARLARELYQTNDIYTGIRNPDEFNAVKAERLFDYAIWVDRSKHVPPESTASNRMTIDMADYVIDNNGTLEELQIKTRALYWDLLSLEHAGTYEPKGR